MTLGPLVAMVDILVGLELHHGERGDLDPAHEQACLCGEPFYLYCPHFDEGISAWVIKSTEPA